MLERSELLDVGLNLHSISRDTKEDRGKILDFPSISQYLNEIGGRSYLTKEDEARLSTVVAPYRALVRDVMSQFSDESNGIPLEERAEAHILRLICNISPLQPAFYLLAYPIYRGRAAIEELMDCNYQLVIKKAQTLRFCCTPALSFGDLITAGNFALRRAALNFDHTREFRFTTFAGKCIRWGIQREINEIADAIHVSRDMTQALVRYEQLIGGSKDNEGEEDVDSKENEKEAILPKTLVSLKAARLAKQVVSLDAEVKDLDGLDDDEHRLIDISKRFTSSTYQYALPENEYLKKELRAQLVSAMKDAGLDERAQEILLMAYGFYNGECWKTRVIGKYFNVSHQRITQLKKESLVKLQKAEIQERLKAYLR